MDFKASSIIILSWLDGRVYAIRCEYIVIVLEWAAFVISWFDKDPTSKFLF